MAISESPAGVDAELDDTDERAESAERAPRRRKRGPRITMIIRRVHLYAGLFLLPWVFLYGVTGAMYNHQGLLPEVEIHSVDASHVAGSKFSRFPKPNALAEQVIAELRKAAPDSTISLVGDHEAEFTSPIALELVGGNPKRSVHIDPINRSARVLVHSQNHETLEPLLADVRNITLDENPHVIAEQSVPDILAAAGIESDGATKPMG